MPGSSWFRRHAAALLGVGFLACLGLCIYADVLSAGAAPLSLTTTMVIVGATFGVACASVSLWILTRRGVRTDVAAKRPWLVPVRWTAFGLGVCVAAFLLVPPSAYFGLGNGGALSCNWATPFHGAGIQPGQEGAVRCYLKAVADRDFDEIRQVVPDESDNPDDVPSVRAFMYSRDARQGAATVILTQNADDSADFQAYIRYADGKVDVREFHIAIPDEGASWRDWDINSHSSERYIV